MRRTNPVVMVCILIGVAVLINDFYVVHRSEIGAWLNTKTVGLWNALEAVLWTTMGLLFAIKSSLHAGGARRRGLITACVLIVFGISDFVELHTGAWWRPWWLLVWKILCVVGLGAILCVWLLGRQKKVEGRARMSVQGQAPPANGVEK
jgi:hypothetical protein